MKGLLKGLKYISNMFDDKEPEMQIGLPTDVKHVAHIGIDGASANKPTWMGEFSSGPELSSAPINGNAHAELMTTGNRGLPPTGNEKKKKQRRKQSNSSTESSPAGSPKGTAEKHSRRQRTSNLSMESPGRDDHGRRHQKNTSRSYETSSSRSNQSSSSSQELPEIPKRTGRRKKTKDLSGGGGGSGDSSASSKSKGLSSLPDIMELQP